MKQSDIRMLIKFIEEHHNEPDEVPSEDANLADIVNFMIITDSDDSRVDDFRAPLLSWLIQTENFRLALNLIRTPESGIDVNLLDSRNFTPLDCAHLKHKNNIIKELENKGAYANHQIQQDIHDPESFTINNHDFSDEEQHIDVENYREEVKQADFIETKQEIIDMSCIGDNTQPYTTESGESS